MNATIIVIDNDAEARMRIKQAALLQKDWATIIYYGSPEEALTSLQHRKHCDVIIISNRFSRDVVRDFFQRLKKAPATQNTACIISVSKDQSGVPTITGNLLLGIDGFLVEPYSIETFIDTVKLAQRVKSNGAENRREYALRFLLNEIFDQIEAINTLRKQGASAAISRRVLNEMGSVLRDLEPDLAQRYFEILLQTADESASPEKVATLRLKSGGYRTQSGKILKSSVGTPLRSCAMPRKIVACASSSNG